MNVSFIKNQKFKQFFYLYSSSIICLVTAFLTSMVNTKLLVTQFYGDLKFIQASLTMFLSLTTFGVVYSGSRLIALESDEKTVRELSGSLLIISIAISAIMCMAVFIFSLFQGKIFDNQLDSTYRYILPLVFAFPLNLFIKNILQGSNKILDLSYLRVMPQILYLGTVYAWVFLKNDLSVLTALLIQMGTLGFTTLYYSALLKPRFSDIWKRISLIIRDVKKFGWHVYTGSLANIATQQLGVFAIAYYVGNIDVGFYSLALVTASPLVQIPETLGTVFYKEFANTDFLNARSIAITIAASFASLLFYFLIISHFFTLFYPKEFSAAIPLAYVISIGSIMHGLGDYINRFLGAHGHGIALRNSAIAEGLINVSGFICFVYFWGPMGAALTVLFAGSLYFIILSCYYYRYATTKKSRQAIR